MHRVLEDCFGDRVPTCIYELSYVCSVQCYCGSHENEPDRLPVMRSSIDQGPNCHTLKSITASASRPHIPQAAPSQGLNLRDSERSLFLEDTYSSDGQFWLEDSPAAVANLPKMTESSRTLPPTLPSRAFT